MKKTTSPVWGGRFQKESSSLLKKINNSISFDYQLGFQDVMVNKVYSEALKKAKIITDSENKKIQKALDEVYLEMSNQNFIFDENYEDIHMNMEMAVKKKIGDTAGKMHTGKSRNDQVATDLKIWVLEKTNILVKKISKMQRTLLKLAQKHIYTLMPGFTHMQNAQPISFSHYLMSIFEMINRDKLRLKNLVESMIECPLGSGALVGTNFFSIDRKFLAKKLGFKKPTENSLDSVSDRDFVVEFLSYLSIISMHFSRIAEDLIIWSSNEYNFIEFPDTLSTGSSIMPQKKNPDSAELIRAKTARVISSLLNVLIVLKGLPSGYSKDLQEDKEPVFDAYKSTILMLDVLEEIIKSMRVKKEEMFSSTNKGYITSTDLADWMVKELGINFREAHKKTGKIVLLAEKKKKKLHELPLDLMQTIEPNLTNEIYKIISPEKSVYEKKSYGGTGFAQIKEAIKRAKRKL